MADAPLPVAFARPSISVATAPGSITTTWTPSHRDLAATELMLTTRPRGVVVGGQGGTGGKGSSVGAPGADGGPAATGATDPKGATGASGRSG
jgi:hypothetical protein